MTANGVHETANSAGTGTLTLIASGVAGEIRVGEAEAVGAIVKAVLKSQSSDKWEEGYYKVAASNTLERTLPTRTWDGVTLDKSPAAPLDFGTETVDVWVTPISGGLAEHQTIEGSAITSHADAADNLIPMLNTSYLGSSYTWSNNRQVWFPAYKGWSGDIDGLAIYASAAWNASAFVDVYLYYMDHEGGFGTKIDELLTKNATASGWLQMNFASATYLPAGMYWISAWADDGGSASFPAVATMEIDECMPLKAGDARGNRGIWEYRGASSLDPPPTNKSLNVFSQNIPRMAWIKT